MTDWFDKLYDGSGSTNGEKLLSILQDIAKSLDSIDNAIRNIDRHE